MLNDKVKPVSNHFVSSNNNEFIPKAAERCHGKVKKAKKALEKKQELLSQASLM